MEGRAHVQVQLWVMAGLSQETQHPIWVASVYRSGWHRHRFSVVGAWTKERKTEE